MWQGQSRTSVQVHAWHVYIKCCRNQASVSGFKRSFEDGEAGEGGRGKNFADVVPQLDKPVEI